MEVKMITKVFQAFFMVVVFSCTIALKETIQVSDLSTWQSDANTTIKDKWTYQSSGLYFVCALGGDRADSYVTTPYIPTSPAAEIELHLSYRLRDCAEINSHCIYFFQLYTRRSNTVLSDRVNPFNRDFSLVHTISNATVLKTDKQTKFNKTLTIGMEGKSGIYLSFRDLGICGNIDGLKMSYYSCPTISPTLVKFQSAAAPNTTTSVQRAMGDCVENSIPIIAAGNNYMDCYSNGTGRFHGGCHCIGGYEKKGDICSICPAKHFKDSAGNQACFKCGMNVVAGSIPRDKICKCIKGFFRPTALLNIHTANCEAPPSPPMNVKVSNISSTSAVVQWELPAKGGTGDKVTFLLTVTCETGCNHKINDISTNNLSFNLTNLKTYINYNVTVYSINNVSRATDQKRGFKIGFKTKSGLPGEVRDVKIVRNNDGSVTVKWQEPAAKGGPDLKYRIRYGSVTFLTTKTNFTILQRKQKQNYDVMIDSHTNAGYSKAKTIPVEVFGKPESSGVSTGAAIGGAVGLGVALLIAIGLFIHYYKRRHPAHLKPVRLENGEVILPSGVPVYVDPTTYQDLADAVREFAKELDRQWIQLERLIGGGEFGDVYKGSLHRPLEDERTVAIKTLKSNANKKARDDFLSEAAYMGQFENPNVIGLEGVVVKDRPIMIIIEFMSNGSLDSYLQENDGKFTNLQLLGMARGVANGMTYLAELSFIHRDLAARNVLVDENMVCKVADFGMSRELTQEETYNTTGGKIPVRWTAPEAIQYKKFTTASDVWSYGILNWEIMSYAERPYWDWGNYEVVERLASGYRLPPPMGCPKVVHDLMLSCWHKDRVKRPKFRDIRTTIDKWIRNPELLRQEASVVTKRDENLDYASMKTLKEWLDSIKMGQYIENFTNKGLVTPRQILEINDENLKEIGILAIGHRNKIIKSINATKGQMNNELSRTKSMAV